VARSAAGGRGINLATRGPNRKRKGPLPGPFAVLGYLHSLPPCPAPCPDARRESAVAPAAVIRSSADWTVGVTGGSRMSTRLSQQAWVVVEKAPEIRKIVEATDPRTD
jgi:hypothetical protein